MGTHNTPGQDPMNRVNINHLPSGAWQVLVNGQDIAGHITDFTIHPGLGGDPTSLVVTIPCDHITMNGDPP